jgi:hypothetical protein
MRGGCGRKGLKMVAREGDVRNVFLFLAGGGKVKRNSGHFQGISILRKFFQRYSQLSRGKVARTSRQRRATYVWMCL